MGSRGTARGEADAALAYDAAARAAGRSENANFEPMAERSDPCAEQAPPQPVQCDAGTAIGSHDARLTAAVERSLRDDRAAGAATGSDAGGTIAAELARRGVLGYAATWSAFKLQLRAGQIACTCAPRRCFGLAELGTIAGEDS